MKGQKKNGKLFLLICIVTFVAVLILKLSETALIVESTSSKLKKEGALQYHELADAYSENIATRLDMFHGHMDLYCKTDKDIYQ